MSIRKVYTTLNVRKAESQTTIEGLHVGDVGSTQLVISLTDGTRAIDLTKFGTVRAMIHGKKPDGYEIHNACTVEGGKIYYTLTAQDAAVSGTVYYQLDVLIDDGSGEERCFSPCFRTQVSERVYEPVFRLLDSDTPPEDWAQNYANYYKKEDDLYVKNDDPTYEADTFYVLVDPPVESASEFQAFWSAYNKTLGVFSEVVEARREFRSLSERLENTAAPTDDQVAPAVSEWLAAHPEITTSLQDGEVTSAKIRSGAVTAAKLGSDVNTILDGKVIKPSTSPNGTNGQLLRTKGDGTTEWVDVGLPTDAQTAEAVSDWLDDHPEATTTVEDGSVTLAKLHSGVIDNTLSTQGAAAEAKTTGNKIAGLNSAVDEVKNAAVVPTEQLYQRPYIDLDDYSDGTALKANGGTMTQSNTICSKYILIGGSSITVNIYAVKNSTVAVCFYDSAKNFISALAPSEGTSGSWQLVNGTYSIPQNTWYIRYCFMKNNTSVVAANQYISFTELQSSGDMLGTKADKASLVALTSGKCIWVSDVANVRNVSSLSYAKVSCSAGDVFAIKGAGGPNARLWFFLDSNNTVLQSADSNQTETKLKTLIAPTGSAYIVVNIYNDSSGMLYKGIPDALLAYETEGAQAKFTDLYGMTEEYNLYDPQKTYKITDKNGVEQSFIQGKYVINSDGTITCTAANASVGSMYIVNSGRTLKAGTYTISGKITYDDSIGNSTRSVCLRVGRAGSYETVILKTERGGSTNVQNSDKEGWFSGTYTVEANEDFAFIVEPTLVPTVSTSAPAVISNLQILSGSKIGTYSPNRYTNVDLLIRDEVLRGAASIAQNAQSITQNTLALKNSHGIVYTTSSARHTFSGNSSTGGLTITVGGKLNVRLCGDIGTKNWEDISTEISDNIVIDSPSASITLSSYSQALVYNTGDKKLHIRNLSQNSGLVVDDIVLVANAYANPVGGCLYNEYIDRMVTDMGDFVHSNEILSRSFNSAYHTGATNFAEKCKEFSALLKGTIDTGTGDVDVTAPTNFESFLFFTDPHLLEGSAWENRCQEFIAQIQKYYNSTPTSFCLCGGDWLGNSDLPDDACFKLGYIDGFMHSMFDNCYMILGNHDTNYQGKRDASSATHTTRLTNQSLVDLWYRGGKRAYYTFDGANTKFYCLDTQTDSDTLWTFNNYGAQQVAWFGNSLLTDNTPHIALAMHILYNWFSTNDGVVDFASSGVNPIAAEVVKIAAAYNARSSVTFNGTTYDYSSATGRIEFLICGHAHKDFEVEELAGNGITTLALDFPCIGTLNVRKNESLGASFDLCFADYDNREIKLIRVGSGENRTFSLDPAVRG